MKLSEKQLLVVTIAATIVIVLPLAGLGYFWLNKEKVRLQKDVSAAEQETKQLQNKKTEMIQMQQRVEELQKEKGELMKILPTHEELSYENFLNTLEELKNKAGVGFFEATPVEEKSMVRRPGAQQTTTPKGFKKVSYKVQLTGEFFELMSFVCLLETYERFIKVDSFSFKPDSG